MHIASSTQDNDNEFFIIARGGFEDRHMKLLTIETEGRLGTLWDQEPRRAVSRKILAAKTGRNWIGHGK